MDSAARQRIHGQNGFLFVICSKRIRSLQTICQGERSAGGPTNSSPNPQTTCQFASLTSFSLLEIPYGSAEHKFHFHVFRAQSRQCTWPICPLRSLQTGTLLSS